MIAKHNLLCAALVAAVVAGTSVEAFACTSCGAPATYSAGYAPATYSAGYAPVAYTTAYAPTYTTASSGWYPGYYMDRARANWWGARTYTAAYPVTYTAGYANTAYYAPASYASYSSGCSSCAAPACSSCTASYAPACSSCSSCDSCSGCAASYTPACTGCATGCSSCGGAATISQVSYTEATPACTNCAPAATSTTTTVSPPPTTTYSEPPSTQRQPELAPTENPAPERLYESQKPSAETTPIQPEPQADPAEESATFEAPHLLNPNDRTAQQRHQAPVLTAVYHKPVATTTSAVQTVSSRQAVSDADGWVSASE